jgi:hypothetical protein
MALADAANNTLDRVLTAVGQCLDRKSAMPAADAAGINQKQESLPG